MMSLILSTLLICALLFLFGTIFFVATTAPARASAAPPEVGDEPELALERVALMLLRGAVEGSYATFLFYPEDLEEEADPPSFQLTYAGGRVCIDWALAAARSVRDSRRFDAYARVHAEAVSRQIGPGGSYIRVIADNPPEFCRAMLFDLYGVDAGDRLVMIFHGIDWAAMAARRRVWTSEPRRALRGIRR